MNFGKPNKIPNALLLSIMGLGFAFIFCYRWYIAEQGIFTLARKTGVSEGGKNGASSEYKYSYSGKEYHLSIIDNGTSPNYIYIKLISNSPANKIVLSDLTVPECLRTDSLLGHTWKRLPDCR